MANNLLSTALTTCSQSFEKYLYSRDRLWIMTTCPLPLFTSAKKRASKNVLGPRNLKITTPIFKLAVLFTDFRNTRFISQDY